MFTSFKGWIFEKSKIDSASATICQRLCSRFEVGVA